MKLPYLSLGLMTGLLFCSVVALTVNIPSANAASKHNPHAQTDEETKLLDDTMGGAIAPRNKHDDVENYSGALSDRIANDHDAAIADKDEDVVKVRKKMPRGQSTPIDGMFKTVEQENPFAPVHPDHSNKVSFGTVPKMSYIPGFGPPLPALNGDDIKRIAGLLRDNIDVNRLTPEMEAEYGLPAGTSEAMNNLRSPRIDGMLPSEFMVKSTIDSLMQIVSQRQGDSRKQAATAAYDRLSQMADALRQMKSVPEDMYIHMGVGDAYMKDSKEGYTNGLDRVQEALQALDAIKKGNEQ